MMIATRRDLKASLRSNGFLVYHAENCFPVTNDAADVCTMAICYAS